jgi:hypothetical protein
VEQALVVADHDFVVLGVNVDVPFTQQKGSCRFDNPRAAARAARKRLQMLPACPSLL